MRILGTIMLVMGIIFAALFVIIAFSGELNSGAFFIPVVLIVIGLTIRNAATGILQQQPSATSGGAAAAQSGAGPTVELPVTPQVTDAISRYGARSRRLVLWLTAGAFVFMLGIGIVLGLFDQDRKEGRQMMVILGGVGVVSSAMIGGISWLTSLRPIQRDLGSTVYLRTTGPVQTISIRGGYMLRLADRGFIMNGRGGASELATLGSGTVDHSPHGHVIIAVWNREASEVYTLPGYKSERPPSAG